MRVLTGPDGMSRDVGENADDAEIGQLGDCALWAEAGLSVPDRAWPGTSESSRPRAPRADESTCTQAALPAIGKSCTWISEHPRGLRDSVGERGKMRPGTDAAF